MRRILFIILSSALFFIGNIHAQVATSDSLVMHYLQQQGIPVTANNEVKLLMSGREKFLDLFEEIRHAKHHIHLEYSLIVSQVKADSWRFETARERYNMLMHTHPEVIKRAPLSHIASYLLMTPETLSRVRSGIL